MAVYIMSNDMFNDLSHVRGFNDCNGKNYQEHITIIMEHLLKDTEIQSVLNCNTPNEALQYLRKIGIDFTHVFCNPN